MEHEKMIEQLLKERELSDGHGLATGSWL
jgi:hypothetical protein